MSYDLVIRGGTVIDGSGLPRYRADVGILGDRIARIGKIRERGREEVDARHHVVAPGFIDGHTHMDAQVAWDPLGTCSCWHGVTSVVMGNCGFTLAPCRPHEKHLVVRNLERAEDIPAEARRASSGRGRRTPSTSTPSSAGRRGSTTRATSATRRCAPMPWASARSPSRRPRKIWP